MKQLLFVILCFATLSLNAQSDNEWVLFRTVEGVEFYQKQVDCEPENIPNQTGILIKIVNTNRYDVQAEWNLRIWYDGEEQTKNIKDQENHIIQPISKKESVEGDCANPNGNLYVFKKFITFSNSAEMTNFQFDELIIKKL